MSDNIGKIGWIDMTVDNASGLAGGRFCVIEDPNGATSCAVPALTLLDSCNPYLTVLGGMRR
jgi:hypothetical protein